MKQEKILVLGGTGKTGSRVVTKQRNRGCDSVRIGSRKARPAFDWGNPGTWPKVVEGIDSVYITFQPDLAVPDAVGKIENFVDLAVESGVRKMVLLSGRGEKEARVCEQLVMNAAPSWSIVRASWFNQNFSESIFLQPILEGHVALPRADALEPFVDADDIADVVVETLLDDNHHGKIYELTGPRLLTFPQAVAEISKAAGRDIKFQPLTLEEYEELLTAYNLPKDEIWLANYLFREVLDGRNASVTSDIETVLGRKPIDFSEYVRNTVVSGIWNSSVENNKTMA